MLERMDNAYWNMRTKGQCFVQKIKEEERGASDIVAIIAIIVIVLAVAVIFRKQLEDVVTSAFKNVTDWIGTGKKDGAS